MNIKNFTAGSWISCVAAVLSLVAVIAYGLNVSGAGYFQNATVSNLVLFCILAVILLAAAVVLSQLRLPVSEKLADLIAGVCLILAPVLLAFCLINFVAARAEGFGFIYFSDPTVRLEVQTAANMSSATGAIVTVVCLAVAMIASVAAAFCSTRKKA